MLNEQTASMEDYLEAIARLRDEGKVVRVKHISEVLNVKMPSVTSALKKLSREGLVRHRPYGDIDLTSQGDEAARDVMSRHKALSCFFSQALDIDPGTAEEDACKIEHVISPLSLDRLTKLLEFIQACPLRDAGFPERYKYYLEHGKLPEECLARMSERKKVRK
jgi:DtxR family Mn-dependent transcriptional regulator